MCDEEVGPIAAAGAGGLAALESLFRSHWREVFCVATTLLRNPDAAADVVQEVFLRALKRRDELQRTLSPVAWLCRVAGNLCLNEIRDNTNRRRILARQRTRPWVGAPQDAAVTARALLGHLPGELRSIAIQYFVDGMTQQEIAVACSLPRRTVAHRLSLCRSRLLAPGWGAQSSSADK